MAKRIVFVTASARGIGFAIVRKFAQAGDCVYLGYFDEKERDEALQKLTNENLLVHPVYNDATKKETYAQAIQSIVKKEGRLDVLVNNFGTSNPKTDLDIKNTTYEDFMSTLDLNLASVYLPVQAAIPFMKEQGGGAIINISSIGGILPDIARIGYATSKNAINCLTKNMALQLGRDNITVNAVCPGQTATDAVKKNLPESFQQIFMKHTPIKRMAEPEEIAEAVFYFASPQARFTTGQILAVHGGFGLGTPIFGDFAKD